MRRTGLPGFDFDRADERAAMGHLLGLAVDRNFPKTGLVISALVHKPVMDFGWIVSLADPVRPGVRLSLLSHDEPGRVCVEIDDVEASVRRFIACDPDGKVVNVLSHR